MLNIKETAIINICKNNHQFFLKKSNVNGIALGSKIITGVNTKEPCLQVFVTKKIPLNQLKSTDVIPTDYLNVKTDVIETGAFNIHALTSLVRPMLFGYSVGPYNINGAGTAGCYVFDKFGYYILSNNHVLANENKAIKNTAILQPAVLDGGIYTKDVVAKLTNFIPIKFSTTTSTPTNYVDCAIAKVNSTALVSKEISLIGPVKGLTSATIDMSVKKSGRTTGLTTGTIIATNATVNVGYRSGTALFMNQIVTTAMSSPGDSGSLLLDNNNKAIGLLFGGSSTATIYNPIVDVLNNLKVQLVV